MASRASKECSICNEVFSEASHCPKILPCSHCFCAPCIDAMIANDCKSCPFCRKDFGAKAAKDLGTNFNLLDILQYVSELEQSKESTPSRKLNEESIANCKRAARHLDHAMSCNSALRNAATLAEGKIDSLISALRVMRGKNEKLLRTLSEDSNKLQTQANRIADREKFFVSMGEMLAGGGSISPRSPSEETVKKLNTAVKGLMEDMKSLLNDWERRRCRAEKDIERRKNAIGVIEEILMSNERDEEI